MKEYHLRGHRLGCLWVPQLILAGYPQNDAANFGVVFATLKGQVLGANPLRLVGATLDTVC